MKILRNILAVIIGWGIGSAVNMGLITAGHSVYPMEGVDPNDMEALAAAMPDASFEHFIFPFLAHAIGTLIGALVAVLIAATHKMKFAYAMGGLFLLGGIMVSFMIPAPTWFTVLDIAIAYIPMAWIGGKIGMSLVKK